MQAVTIDGVGEPRTRDFPASFPGPGELVLRMRWSGLCGTDLFKLATGSARYDELSLLGSYHHTPRSFRAAIDRLSAARSDYRLLLSHEEPLENIEEALRAMMARRAIKVVIRQASA